MKVNTHFYLNAKMMVCIIAYIGIIFIATGCFIFNNRPESFIRMSEPTWSSIEIKSNITPDDAWQQVVDVVAKKFELEMISKEGGYVRTAWIYTWWKQGEVTSQYRVRVIVKFSADWKKVDVKTDANYLRKGVWEVGYDTRLLETVKTDIMGVVGRTTR